MDLAPMLQEVVVRQQDRCLTASETTLATRIIWTRSQVPLTMPNRPEVKSITHKTWQFQQPAQVAIASVIEITPKTLNSNTFQTRNKCKCQVTTCTAPLARSSRLKCAEWCRLVDSTCRSRANLGITRDPKTQQHRSHQVNNKFC